MKQKIFTLLIAIAAGTCLLCASNTQVDGIWYSFNSSTKTASVTYRGSSYNSYDDEYSGSVNIPSSVKYEGVTYSVKSIGYEAFSACKTLTSVTIPNSVTSIGESAFSGCGLISMIIPNSVTKIEKYAFYGCISLTSVTIPNSVTSIGSMAFYNVPNIVYNGSATGSPWMARSVNGFVDGWLVYSDNTKTTLLACSAAASGEITIPNSVTSIGDDVFSGCKNLTFVNIPNSVTSIGKHAFSNCSDLISVTIPNSIASIGEYAFLNCISLVSVTIPNSVTNIGSGAFFGCTSLISVTIPNSATSIETGVFNECHSLTSVTIPNSVTSIGGHAFNNCSALTSIEIPNSVTYIGENAFFGCTGLTSVTIPNSVTSIGSMAFYNVPNIVYNGSATGSPWMARSVNGFVDGWLVYSDNTKTTLLACSAAASGEITIPNSVTSIEKSAFYGCKSLVSVEIPNSVTSIGTTAFLGCSGLTSVTIPNSITSMGECTFFYCTGLTSVIWNAKHCQDFTIENTPFYYHSSSSSVFSSSYNYDLRTQITSFIFGDEVEYIPAYLCSGMKKVSEIVVPNCKIIMGTNALYGCKYRIDGVVNINLSDTTLCYAEDLYIDGVKCPLSKKVNIKQTWTQNYKTIEGCDSTITISVTWRKFSDFTITTKDEFDTPNSGSISYKKSDTNYSGKFYYTLNGEKNASLYNLSAGTYQLVFYSEDNCGDDSIVKSVQIKKYGMKVNGQYYLLDEKSHTATLTYRGTAYSDYSGEYSGDITIPKTFTFEGEEYNVVGINGSTFDDCNNITSITMESETPISMPSYSGLSNDCIIYVPYGSLNTYKSNSNWNKYNLYVINPTHATATSSATSTSITFGDADEQKHIASCGIDGGETSDGYILEYISLEPESEYKDVPFVVKTKEGDIDIMYCSFSTTALELTTKASVPVSEKVAILLAETNMADIETSCGFEWKRNDAPEDMAPNKVVCPVANGVMAGRLKNLKDDVYYKYRAFYESAAGNKYYGEWQYIFTGDVAVEFDPILYTYAAALIKEREATLKGYALAGSTDFTEQGFEYWAESRAPLSNAPRRQKAALGERHTVTASGISMKTTLSNLDPGTNYRYRTYAKIGDQILYGSEMTFTTQGEFTYAITFTNWNGEELLTLHVAENALPEYTGETPERPEDEEYTYEFSGWSPSITTATSDVTYTAQFTAVPKSPSAINQITDDQLPLTNKIFREGQVLIQRGDKLYPCKDKKRSKMKEER